ncbi:MAG: sigma-70 family RNA polymerase sigma factor [Candidatus Eisenbacteria bacterium]|nr:sigma-70 family RNA polymerase sigma factor [Candidatus Eisenbacteria bacterium]
MEYPCLDDFHSLLAGCMSGDRAAWHRLFTRYAPLLSGALHGAGAPQDAVDDLIGDVFVKLMDGNARALRDCAFENERAFHGWLVRLAKNHYVDQTRHDVHVRRLAASPPGSDPPAMSEHTERLGGDNPLAGVAARDEVEAAMSCLSSDEQAVISLAYYQELTHPEIAEATGRPVGTIAALISRAREKMRRHLHRIAGLERFSDGDLVRVGGRRDD